MARRESFRVFGRASLEQLTDTKSNGQSSHHLKAPPRPASAFARTSSPRPLSNIPEAPFSGSETGNRATVADEGSKVLNSPGTYTENTSLPFNRAYSSSTYSLPLSRVPVRMSSRVRLQRRPSRVSKAAGGASKLPRPSRGAGRTIPDRGQSTSPVRSAARRLNPVTSDMRRMPSRTFVRSVKPTDILDFPELSHPRVSLEVQTPAPLCVGGGTVEGQVRIIIDGNRSKAGYEQGKAVSIGRISVDVLGVETSYGKSNIYRSLAVELVDEEHAPPSTMIAASRALSDAFWQVKPSDAVLPFCLNLPVNMGPPPYSSKHANIKYILCATIAVKISGKQSFIRKSQEIAILTVHDPEKALVNLPNPLTASDELFLSKLGTHKVIRLTAGVHRQTWVSGIAMFVDVHISNSSSKTVRKIEFQLEKVTTFYDYAAAATKTEIATHLRLPDRTEKEIVARSSVKKARNGWHGVLPQSQDIRTCRLDVPAGLITVNTGRYFGVRFFLSVLAHSAFSKPVTVQIPITLIHPNSLDIPPNSLAQVALAISHRHTNSRASGRSVDVDSAAKAFTHSVAGADAAAGFTFNEYKYIPGSAFTAARRKSVDEIGKGTLTAEQIDDLTRTLERSPRKSLGRSSDLMGRHNSIKRSQDLKEDNVSPSYQKIVADEASALTAPHLMRSTSGLAFDDLYDSTSDADADGESSDPITTRNRSRNRGRTDSGLQKLSSSVASRRQKSLPELEEGRLTRELKLARKRSRTLGEAGRWRNVAVEEVQRKEREGQLGPLEGFGAGMEALL